MEKFRLITTGLLLDKHQLIKSFVEEISYFAILGSEITKVMKRNKNMIISWFKISLSIISYIVLSASWCKYSLWSRRVKGPKSITKSTCIGSPTTLQPSMNSFNLSATRSIRTFSSARIKLRSTKTSWILPTSHIQHNGIHPPLQQIKLQTNETTERQTSNIGHRSTNPRTGNSPELGRYSSDRYTFSNDS